MTMDLWTLQKIVTNYQDPWDRNCRGSFPWQGSLWSASRRGTQRCEETGNDQCRARVLNAQQQCAWNKRHVEPACENQPEQKCNSPCDIARTPGKSRR